MRITPFLSVLIHPDTSWALLLLPAFQHQVWDTHSSRGCGGCCLVRQAAAHYRRTPPATASGGTGYHRSNSCGSHFLSLSGNRSFFQGPGWSGCRSPQGTSCPNKHDFSAMQSGSERSAVLIVGASKEGPGLTWGYSVMHTLSQKGWEQRR